MLFVETLSEQVLDSTASALADSTFTSPASPPPPDQDRLGSNAAAGPGMYLDNVAGEFTLYCTMLETCVQTCGWAKRLSRISEQLYCIVALGELGWQVRMSLC